MYNLIKQKIKLFLERFGTLDPVKHCEVYTTEGCAHVDGFLCKVKNCSIREKYNEKNKPNKVTIAAMEEARGISKQNKQKQIQ